MDDDRQRYEDINTQKARDEVDHKVKQMTAYFSEQDTMLEMTAAYHNMVSRKTAAASMFVSADMEEEVGDLGAEMGYEVNTVSYAENRVSNQAGEAIVDQIQEIDDLENLFVTQGMIKATLKPQAALERRKILESLPADDPDREKKADYLTLGSAGAAGKQRDIDENTSDLMQYFPRINQQVYREYSAKYEAETGKKFKDITLAELAERMQVPEEKRDPGAFQEAEEC